MNVFKIIDDEMMASSLDDLDYWIRLDRDQKLGH